MPNPAVRPNMRLLSFLLLQMALASGAIAQTSFYRTYHLPQAGYITSAVLTPDSHVVMCGSTGNLGLLMCTDLAGNLLWTRTTDAGMVGTRGFMDVDLLPNGDIIAVGGSAQPYSVWYMARFTPNGEGIWYKLGQADPYPDHLLNVDVDTSGQILVSGYREISFQLAQYARPFVHRYDANATLLDGTGFGMNEEFLGGGYAIGTSDNGALAGVPGTLDGDEGGLVRLDDQLNVVWALENLGSVRDMVQRTDGSVIVNFRNVTNSSIVAFDDTTVLWSKEILPPPGWSGMYAFVVASRADGSVLVWGLANGGNNWLASLAPDGSLQWMRQVPHQVQKMIDLGDALLLVGTELGGDPSVMRLETDGSGSCAGTELFTTVVDVPTSYTTVSQPLSPPEMFLSGNATTTDVAYIAVDAACTEPAAYSASGTLYRDHNLNGVFDAGDVGAPFAPVTVDPDQGWLFANGDGSYFFNAGLPDTYTIAPEDPDPWWLPAVPSQHIVDITVNDPVHTGLDFGFTPAIDTTLLSMVLTSSNGNCGDTIQQWAQLQIMTTTDTMATVGYVAGDGLTIVSAIPPPDLIVGDTLLWDLSLTLLSTWWEASIRVQLPGPDSLGMSLGAEMLLWPGTNGTLDPPLATEGWSDVLTCSYDPNDKQVAPVGMGIEGWIPTETEWLDYTIRFQNTGNDTATLVVIEDQLPATVQWGTLAIQGASHTLTSISINPFGKATFAFDDIHLPDSGANELASHGFVRFRIRPQAGLPDGTIISNNAGIFFDATPAVVTNSVVNTIFDCSVYAASIDEPITGVLEASAGVAYQWSLNGQEIPGGTAQQLEPMISGSYTVQVTSDLGCIVTSGPYPFVVTDVLGSSVNEVAVAPNPFSRRARVRASEVLGPNDHIEVLDVDGRIHRTLRGIGTREVIIERDGLGAGLYLVRVIHDGAHFGAVRLLAE